MCQKTLLLNSSYDLRSESIGPKSLMFSFDKRSGSFGKLLCELERDVVEPNDVTDEDTYDERSVNAPIGEMVDDDKKSPGDIGVDDSLDELHYLLS
ncbi:15139_t:CDS:2 [Funneliformis mosseae]|uniref:15139_t:CDS:1 n=1 Tax=Funneliformis mosseae TaxID=27381 RepID=A0A9N9H537_FUNMO|nr:15139_t:CDS:2 [Funneliformis mosseae]